MAVIDSQANTMEVTKVDRILAKAMDDQEARRLIERYSSAGFEEAMKQLKSRYGRPAAVYPQLVEELVARNRYDYSQESMHQILEHSQLVLAAMDKVNGKTIEQLTVALVVRDFDNELEKEWVKHLGDEDKLPDMDTLLEFIKPLSHNLSRKKKVLSAVAASFRPAAAKSVPDHQSDHPRRMRKRSTLLHHQCPASRVVLFAWAGIICCTCANSSRMPQCNKDGTWCVNTSIVPTVCTRVTLWAVVHLPTPAGLANPNITPCFTRMKKTRSQLPQSW